MRRFDADAMLDRCARGLRLERFVDAGLRARFRHLIALFNDFGTVDEPSWPEALAQVEHVVAMRLRLARDWEREPRILSGRIAQPFFVAGNARAGTTLVQNLLCLDEGHRTPRYWDVRHPSPPPGSDPAALAEAVAEEDAYVRWILRTSPRLLAAHPYFEQGAQTEAEDEYLHAFDFHTPYPLPYLKVPSLPQCPLPQDPVAALRFHKQMLQQLQWARPTRRWVGKGVMHQYLMPALLEVYPDAACFWIHRSPEEYIPSLIALLEVQYQPFNRGRYRMDPQALVQQLKLGVDHFMASPATADPRVHHIRFQDIVRDPVATIRGVYEAIGAPFSDGFRRRLTAQMSGPGGAAHRHGRLTYSLEQYGLTRAGLRTLFADYCVRFGV